MDEYIRIILEFEKDTVYSPSKIASKLLELYPELGNEIILPIDMNQENSVQVPIFIFQQNPDFQITGNFYNIIITVSEKYFKNVENIVNNIFEMFKSISDFSALACIFQKALGQNKISEMKNKFLNVSSIQESDNVQINMLRYIEISKISTRCLEGYATTDDNLLSHFEFNMKRDEGRRISYDCFLKFYNECVKYMDERKF